MERDILNRYRYIKFILLVVAVIAFGYPKVCQAEMSNRPPSINYVIIRPEIVYKNSDIKVEVKGTDPDGDSISYSYNWYINGTELPGATSDSLGDVDLIPGDIIKVKVIPFDGKEQGEPEESKEKVVQRYPPRVLVVEIFPNPAKTDDVLKVRVAVYDMDDSETKFQYRWHRNGEVIEGQNRVFLLGANFKKGDRIQAEVMPEDTEGKGESALTEPIIIQNSHPHITSSPEFVRTGDSTFIYQLTWTDPDNDPVDFSFLSPVPEGLSIDPKTGVITWEVKDTDTAPFSIEILARDPHGGECTQKFTLVPKENI